MDNFLFTDIRELLPRIGTPNGSPLCLQAPETVRRRDFYGVFTDSGSLKTDAETRLLRLRLALRPLKAACVFASSNAENT
jgi:hypothetical protein